MVTLPGRALNPSTFKIIPYFRHTRFFAIDPSHDAAIKGSKRGQEGITNEAIFQFRYFFSWMQSFINFSDQMHRTCNLEKICLFNGYC